MLLSDKNYTTNNVSFSEYGNYQKEIIFNDGDPDLKPIAYKLPEPPKLSTIDGFGLPKAEQYFKRPVFPQKLVQLQKEKISDSAKISKLESNPDYYSEEITFIEREWSRIDNGYWFYNNGIPTYITNYHYAFLVYWHIQNPDSPLPFFCMYDREAFLFAEMCFKDEYCLGFNWPKHRRAGATSIATDIRYFRAITSPLHHSALQSMTDKSAETIHRNHLIYAWDKMAFWFRPIYDGVLTRTTEIKFFSPRFKSHEDYGKDALDSRISYGPCTETFLDGDVVNTIHNDEEGKSIEVNVYERGRIQRPTMMRGTRVIGKSINTSTVEEMDAKGGKVFKKKCDESDYHKRNEITKMTTSGLYTLFIPAHEKLDGVNPKTGLNWIDKYGFADPEGRQYLAAMAAQFEKEGNLQAWADFKRLYPDEYRDCWRPAAKNSPFNLSIINRRLDQINEYHKPLKIYGKFEWYKDQVGSAAFFRPANDQTLSAEGRTSEQRFCISWNFEKPEQANQRTFDESKGLWIPTNTHLFIAGADNFGYRITKGSRKSNAGFAIKMKADFVVDDPRIETKYWTSDRFICTYKYRPPTPEEAADDWMMACCYYGCEVFPETNIMLTNDRFIDSGFGGYLYYEIKDNGKQEVNAGDKTDQQVKELIFARTQSYIERAGMRCCHDEYLEEVRDIYDPAQMVDFDLFTACGYALIGEYKQTSIANPHLRNLKPETVLGESLDMVIDSYDVPE